MLFSLAKRNRLFLKVLSELNLFAVEFVVPGAPGSSWFQAKGSSAAVGEQSAGRSDGCWQAKIFNAWILLISPLGMF